MGTDGKNQLGPFAPSAEGTCTATTPAPGGCWSKAAPGADPCLAVTCSGHGACGGSSEGSYSVGNGTCTCTDGYTTKGAAGAAGAAIPTLQCSVPPTSNSTVKCPGKVDIVLVMDMSLSVQGETWGQKCANFPDDPDQCAFRAEKDFAKSLLAPFYIDSTYTKVAVAFFHRGAVLSLGLNADPTQVRRDETKRHSHCVVVCSSVVCAV